MELDGYYFLLKPDKKGKPPDNEWLERLTQKKRSNVIKNNIVVNGVTSP